MSYHDDFDYEEARRDIIENGCDPDYLDEYDPARRDRYLRDVGLDPRDYGSRRESPKKKDWDWGPLGSSSDNGASSDDGCFVTTACIRSRGLPDDCEELTVLRAFRDGWVQKRPGGKKDIDRYYSEAPGIVARINGREDAAEVWDEVYFGMIRPCVEMIRKGNEEAAYILYRDWTLRLAEI